MPLSRIAEHGLVLLGCGKMGSALLEGWLARGLSPASFAVLEPQPSARLVDLAEQGLRLNAAVPDDPAICVIAVKPQGIAAALQRLVLLGGGGTVFLSIAAGTPIRAFEAALGPATPVVRAMPNTPASVGRGITALIGNSRVTEIDLALAEALMQSVGQTIRLEDEVQMDAVTAVSGSGPAYVFLLIEALAAAGAAEGLPAALAQHLACATVAGAGQLAESSPQSPAQLRVDVTSPGGTTAAALAVLQNAETGLPALLGRAVSAAAARSRELGA